jgi:hypothetical protein
MALGGDVSMRAFYGIAGLLILSACSSSLDKPYFDATNVSAPSNSYCAADPHSFAQVEPVGDFSEGNGCGVSNGYRVFAVADVAFSQPAVVTCSVANTFDGWLKNSVQPRAQSIYGEKVVALKIAASYACRPRNNVRGAKLSEHGMGNAIDIAGFTLASGKEVTVAADYYGSSQNRNFLSSVRSDACGPFHTVLGPGSDPYHNDHIHLDLQKERGGGPYCH